MSTEILPDIENLDTESRKFENYLETLRLKYETSEPPARGRILGSLEKLVGTVLLSGFPAKRDYQGSQKVILADDEKNSTVFNPKLARKIRTIAGLSQTDLANYLSSSQRTISGFESGKLVIRGRKPLQIAYLYWLKDISGYNPFNL